ncbi:MAG TPA: hypothetical protein PLI06_03210 [Methanofastidiosum sp.]|nr:hypothetical protein [Methanofastidiosum sp.]HOI76605.1 hypothetical protein [Methanofastidiosum sp.]
MDEPRKIGIGTRITMKSMHNLSKFYSKTKSSKLRILTHYAILGIFFVSILWKHKPTSISKKSSELKFLVSVVLSWIHK